MVAAWTSDRQDGASEVACGLPALASPSHALLEFALPAPELRERVLLAALASLLHEPAQLWPAETDLAPDVGSSRVEVRASSGVPLSFLP